MSDGSKKPAYVPPTLGDALGRGGMKYDFDAAEESGVQNKKQKKGRNRNKGSRRDSNNTRSPKEVSMEGKDTAVNGNVERGSSNKEQAGDMASIFERSLARLDETVKTFGGELSRNVTRLISDNEEGKAEMRQLVTASTETILSETDKKMKAMNAWNYENVKGDVRKALVQIGVGGVIAGVVALGTYLFSRDDSEVMIEGRPHQGANSAPRQPRAQA